MESSYLEFNWAKLKFNCIPGGFRVCRLCVDVALWKQYKVLLHSVCYRYDVSFVVHESIVSYPVRARGAYKNQLAITRLAHQEVGPYVYVLFINKQITLY